MSGRGFFGRGLSRLSRLEEKMDTFQLQDIKSFIDERMPAGFHNPRYELFDAGVFLVIWSSVAYVWTNPPQIIKQALEQPLEVANQSFWGWVLVSLGIIAIIGTFTEKWITDKIFWLTIVGLLFWGSQPIVAIVFTDAQPRSILTTTVFYLCASHTWRARFRWKQELWS